MFGSSPFGQTSSPFGSQPTFGQNTNASNNPFAPKPFGATSPFGAQSGGSFFGNTSTGVFGSQNSSPLGSTSVFGASSSPAFGTSTPAFGSSSTPTFGSTSVFGQKPAFGSFGASTAPSSSFGGSFQQTQPAFGSNPFNAGSQPAFGTPSTPTFGSSSTPAFGASTSTPAFGSTASPTFGTTTSAFGVSSSPMFGSTTTSFGAPATSGFGAASTPGFGAASTPAFGTTNTPAFGTTNTSAFGSSSTSAFSFSSSPSFGQSASPFGAQSSPSFGQSTSPFGAQSSPFVAQATTPSFGSTVFGQSSLGGHQGGSRVVPYAPTTELDSGTQAAGKLESISAMQAYKDKSHEELRWEDYQRGDKGGPAPTAQTTPGQSFNSAGFGTSPTPSFGQSSSNPFSGTTPASPFAPQNTTFSSSGFGASSTPAFASSQFGSSTTVNPFGSTPSQTQSLFNSTPSFGQASSPFGTSTSLFGSSSAQGSTPGFSSLNVGNTQSFPLFQSNTPSLGQTSSAFGQNPSTFGQNSSTFGLNSSTLGQSAPGFGQPNIFSSPSAGFGGGLFSNTPSLTTSNPMGFGQTPALSMPFQSTQPPQSVGSFGFGNFGQTASAGASGFGGGTSSLFAQNTFAQPSTLQSSVVSQPAPANPFGTLPALPQMSLGRAGNSPSIQYGISSLPVVDKPAPIRISSILTSRHLSQRRIRLPARRYHPQPDAHRVPFFNDDEDTPNTPKADALFIPRENPRALVIRPVEQQQSLMNAGKTSPSKPIPGATHEYGKTPEAVSALPMNGFSTKDKDKESIENGFDERTQPVKQTQKSNGASESYSITLTGHRAGEAAIAYEHGPEIEALMPKLRNPDYFTEPRIQELAAKERVENGYCQHVKNFVVGRHGYGSIKFIGETDVRGLDLESLVQFNNREVIVYMDESKKPPVGQGLNKRAEVTLLNIKCSDKKTGQHFIEGPRIEKYKEMLKRKAEDQGAEFVSYDPVKGEWKFRVEHFSRYILKEEDDELEV